jgi:hypothetical protein
VVPSTAERCNVADQERGFGMNMWRKKDYFRHILYTFVDMAVVPIIRGMAAIGLSRPIHAVTALYRHILWQTKLGYIGAESCLWPHVVIHNP